MGSRCRFNSQVQLFQSQREVSSCSLGASFNDKVKGALMRTYKHLTQEQRYHISALLKIEKKASDIAKIVGVDKSTKKPNIEQE